MSTSYEQEYYRISKKLEDLCKYSNSFLTCDRKIWEIDDKNCLCKYNNYGDSVVEIPYGVKEIYGYKKDKFWWGAFEDNTDIKQVIIPNSVDIIGDNAFEGCESLKSINIPNSVKSIGYMAFAYCYSLESIMISNSVKSIDELAFLSCDNLQTIYNYSNVDLENNRDAYSIPSSCKIINKGV